MPANVIVMVRSKGISNKDSRCWALKAVIREDSMVSLLQEATRGCGIAACVLTLATNNNPHLVSKRFQYNASLRLNHGRTLVALQSDSLVQGTSDGQQFRSSGSGRGLLGRADSDDYRIAGMNIDSQKQTARNDRSTVSNQHIGGTYTPGVSSTCCYFSNNRNRGCLSSFRLGIFSGIKELLLLIPVNLPKGGNGGTKSIVCHLGLQPSKDFENAWTE